MLFRWRGAITLAVREKGGNCRHCLHAVAVLVPDTCTLQTMHRLHFRGLYLVRGMAQLCLRWHGGGMGLPLTWNKLVFKFTFNKNARNIYPVVQILIREWDQGYMIQCIFDPWFLDPGWKKSGQIPDHICESLVIIFGLKILKFFSIQHCRSRFGIWCHIDPWIWDPRSRMKKLYFAELWIWIRICTLLSMFFAVLWIWIQIRMDLHSFGCTGFWSGSVLKMGIRIRIWEHGDWPN
jgi:hypothetical protein